jgi:hypothetical protein
MYGNNYKCNPESTRLFPYILSKIDGELFSFEKSDVIIDKDKEGTSRVVIWRMLKIPAVYTLEVSLCGAAINGAMPHFNIEDLKKIGKKLCLGILVF